jgi:mevalonate kinase
MDSQMSGVTPLATAAIGRGAAKVIVFGEHAVVHGSPALAASLQMGCVCEVRASDGPARLLLSGETHLVDSDHPVARAFKIALQVTGMIGLQIEVRPGFGVPVGAGLGSSAAFAVALCRGLMLYNRQNASPEQLTAWVHQIESCFHGQPSGLDAHLAQFGGIGRFTRGHGFEALKLPATEFIIADSGVSRQTSTLVTQVAERHARLPQVTQPIFASITAVVESGISAWQARDWALLGECLNINQGLLDALSVSHPQNARLVEAARAAGALGAKLTGAGGGGCVMALCGARGDDVERALRALSKSVFRVMLGDANV